MKISILIPVILLSSCQIKSGISGGTDTVPSDTAILNEQFPLPSVPITLIDQEARKSYLLTHYWNNFNFSDTTLLDNRNVTEQGFVDFIALLANESTDELIKKSLDSWSKQVLTSSYAQKVFTTLANDYLYNPNSPYYNEKLYILCLQAFLEKLPSKDVMYSAYNFKLQLCKRNNPGSLATDFMYYLPDGNKVTLAKTPVKSKHLLLIFYDPECKLCHRVMNKMKTDETLTQAIKTGEVSVLAIYTEGNDEAWKKSLPDIPENWTVGSDHEVIKMEALYDLKAMPAIYLLDKQKQVILKDATYENIRHYLW